MHLGTKSRTTNISEPTTLRKSTVSNNPSSSNPFAARTVKFGNDQIAPILGYGDLVQGNGNDLLTNSRGTDLYSITLQDTSTPNLIFLMAKASSSQAWLWHRLHAQVRTVQNDKGMKFLNKTLHSYFAQEGIGHQTSTARTPEQNGVVERRNCTLVEVLENQLLSASLLICLGKRDCVERIPSDHPLEQVIGNSSQSIRIRRQLEIDGEMCMFALTVSRTEPKNIKEAMADSAWIEAMQEELHQFDR
ncbi:retrovirus-related pol polyprotein from transposon TNT 1-94 [Tanacetum coccineum]